MVGPLTGIGFDIRTCFIVVFAAGLDVGEQISRAPGRTARGGYDAWGMKTTSTFKVIGRHVLNLWRIMRSEQTLNIYTFENVVFQLLRRRCVVSIASCGSEKHC